MQSIFNNHFYKVKLIGFSCQICNSRCIQSIYLSSHNQIYQLVVDTSSDNINYNVKNITDDGLFLVEDIIVETFFTMSPQKLDLIMDNDDFFFNSDKIKIPLDKQIGNILILNKIERKQVQREQFIKYLEAC